ncbi:MAG: DNA-deoxyinosine glycosylase [Rhodocyclales bacterium]|nr:DNA-deoxyinosine glycosylase [Rhodocyclales bacterium]
MSRLAGFPPLASDGAHTLILGSMPGAASLAAARYYAHPRNLFWPLVGVILDIAPDLPYAQRTRALTARGYALWDVLGACRRVGSLDSGIVKDTLEINDLPGFLATHREIQRIFFNGAKAEQLFRRHVGPCLDGDSAPACTRLPSTSPANASVDYATKLAAWQRIAA